MVRVLKKYILTSLSCITLCFFSGCASIVHGKMQNVSLSSSPLGATVIIDGMKVGKTPLTKDLRRKDNHYVRFELDGFLPYEDAFIQQTSGWVWGNMLFGGLIGLAIDAINDAPYKLTPEKIHAEMKQKCNGVLDDEDMK